MLAWAETSDDPLYFTLVRLPDERPLGCASYLRITPEFGVIEIGHIWFGTPLQGTTAATEAIYLLARHAFDDLGYRRLEWKCNALSAASRRAADRFGFTFEGVFRKHQIVKGRNRDTAWYAITDDDWPAIRPGYESWLGPENFGDDGLQRRSAASLPQRPDRPGSVVSSAGASTRAGRARRPARQRALRTKTFLPNAAGASACYQILPSTWKEFGGARRRPVRAGASGATPALTSTVAGCIAVRFRLLRADRLDVGDVLALIAREGW